MESSKKITFLRPEHLVPVRSLQLRARHIVEGLIAGLHRSPYHGFSSEFLEFRDYRPGEPASKIDWRTYARTDKNVVRLYEDETNLYARILFDSSASMAFSSTDVMSKFEYARTLAASLVWILIRQRDAVGITIFNEIITASLPPKSTNRQLKSILSHLECAEPLKKTATANAVQTVAGTIDKKGLSILLSDCFDDINALKRALRHLVYKRQDIILLWILDPLEANFSAKGSMRIQDIETGEEFLLDGEIAASGFRSGIVALEDSLNRICIELGVTFVKVITNEPFAQSLIRIMEKRKVFF